MFSIGTEKKAYTTLTVDTSELTIPAVPDVTQEAEHANGNPWEYLLGENGPGSLIVRKRGKLLLLAAGQVRSLSNENVLSP